MAERNGDGKGGGGVQINLELYGMRLKLLKNKWKEHKKEMWGGADAITVVTPPAKPCLQYGELQGLNKKETTDKFGVEKIKERHRSYDIPPPNEESLEMCAKQDIKYFVEHVVPEL